MERASFLVTKWVNALSGTGVGWADVTPFELPPPPDPPAAVVDARVVPLTEVFALEEMAVELAALDNTVELELTLDRADSADVEFTFDVANAVPILPAVSVELVLGGAERPVVEEAVSRPVPVDAAAPEPAPEDDPAVFDADAVDEDAPLVDDD